MKLDYGAGYWNILPGYRGADIGVSPIMDYVIDPTTSRIDTLPDAVCTHINLRNVLHHVKDMRNVLEEVKRLLKSGGCLTISEPKRENWIRNVVLDTWWYRVKDRRPHIWFALKYRNWKSLAQEYGFSKQKSYDDYHNEVEVWKKG